MIRLLAPLNPMPPIPVYSQSPFISYPHPGAFGIPRHKHVHTGVDLYTAVGSPVHAMEDGTVIRVAWFTGAAINMPWWADTKAVYVEGVTGVFNYGEIEPCVKEGQDIHAGEMIGYVIPVLKKWKGRPMSMLHLELYDHGWTDTWGEWKIGDPKPENLKNPTDILAWIQGTTTTYDDPYWETHEAWKRSQSAMSPWDASFDKLKKFSLGKLNLIEEEVRECLGIALGHEGRHLMLGDMPVSTSDAATDLKWFFREIRKGDYPVEEEPKS